MKKNVIRVAAAGFRLRKSSTGLRLVYTKGMMIIVK
jgi:hypothetical protein